MRHLFTVAASLLAVANAPAFVTIAWAAPAQPAAADCPPAGGLSFICGPKNPEDFAVLPDGRWLIASGMAEGGGLHLIDTKTKAWKRWIAPAGAKAAAAFADCDGPPDPERFSAHGLALRTTGKGRARLFVVGHGGREAVEVFDITLGDGEPALAWKGCVRAPDKVELNSVAAAPDGTLLATTLAVPGKSVSDAFYGQPTGAVYERRPGEAAFREVPGTSLPADNGIEISADGRTVYVAATPVQELTAFSRGRTWTKLWTAKLPDTSPDNVHWGPDGRLWAAGMADVEPGCGGRLMPKDGKIDLAGCPRGYRVTAVDPKTGKAELIAKGPALAAYSGTATALAAGGSLWISSFYMDRIAYRPWP